MKLHDPRFRPAILTMLLVLLVTGAAMSETQTDAELTAIRDGFEVRRDEAVQRLAGTPFKPAAKRGPLKPGRGRYTRHYSYTVTDFAMKSFLLGEQLEEANAALAENCRFYSENELERNDRDSFYWATDVICRMVELFGSRGSIAPGRMDAATEAAVLEMGWLYCKDNSRIEDADFTDSETWYIGESENHHLQHFSTLWHFSKFLNESDAYRSRPYDDGHTADEHFAAWTQYAGEFCRERAKKGLFVEIAATGYGFQSIKGIYSFCDFAEDATLRRRAGYLLDLFWATWAQEQIDGVRGGGKARVYQGLNSQIQQNDRIADLANYYLGTGSRITPQGNTFSMITSDYRLPLVVMDIALDREGRGVYATKQRRMGLASGGYYTPPEYRMRTDFGGIYRYTYCAPEYVMGTLMFDARPLADWTMISSQNRWHGVIFRGHPNARIYPQCEAASDRKTLNQQWSVQRGGTLIAQKLDAERFGRRAKSMRVWFSRDGLSGRTERDGWVFVEAEGAYAAVRPVEGESTWQAEEGIARGDWLCCGEGLTPVIIEVARKADFGDFLMFQDAVLGRPMRFDGRVLKYESLGGDEFVFYADYSRLAEVNGEPVELAPRNVFDSPFVQSRWDSGVVTIEKGQRRLVLDFSSP